MNVNCDNAKVPIYKSECGLNPTDEMLSQRLDIVYAMYSMTRACMCVCFFFVEKMQMRISKPSFSKWISMKWNCILMTEANWICSLVVVALWAKCNIPNNHINLHFTKEKKWKCSCNIFKRHANDREYGKFSTIFDDVSWWKFLSWFLSESIMLVLSWPHFHYKLRILIYYIDAI